MPQDSLQCASFRIETLCFNLEHGHIASIGAAVEQLYEDDEKRVLNQEEYLSPETGMLNGSALTDPAYQTEFTLAVV